MCTVIITWWTGGLTCGLNMHGNYYYMVEGSPHVWRLTCTVFTTIWWRGALMYTWVTSSSCVALTCTVITTIWWRGALTCGSCVAMNVHSNYYYMVEGSPHMLQLTCTVITTIWCTGALTCGNLPSKELNFCWVFSCEQHMEYLWMFHSPRDVILTLGMPVDVPKS